jgi:hypothetical protein
VSPPTLDFPATPKGGWSGYEGVFVENTGNAVLRTSSVTLEGANPGDFILSGSGGRGADLAPGLSAVITLAFQPTAKGPRTAKLRIVDNAPGSPHMVTLTGTGGG